MSPFFVVKLVGGGSIINGATPSSFREDFEFVWILFRRTCCSKSDLFGPVRGGNSTKSELVSKLQFYGNQSVTVVFVKQLLALHGSALYGIFFFRSSVSA